MAVYIGINVAIGLAVIFALITNSRRLLWLVGFLLPLEGLGMYVGVRWSWSKILPAVLLLSVVARRGFHGGTAIPSLTRIALMFGYVVCVTAWFWLLDGETERLVTAARAVGWGRGQTDYRFVVQLLMFASAWSLALLAYLSIGGRESQRALMEGYVRGNLASIGAGVYQVLASALRLPWFDPAELGELVQGTMGMREHIQQFAVGGGLAIDRLYGLGGEPKHTAAFAALAMVLVLSQGGSTGARRPRRRIFTLLVLAVGIALTFSTSGWIAMLAVLVGASLHSVRAGMTQVLVSVAVIAAVIGGTVSVMQEQYRSRIIEDRFISRLEGGRESIFGAEYKDGALAEYAKDRPEGLLFGKGVGGIDFYLIPYVGRYSIGPGSTITPTYFLTRTLGEVGVVGLGLILSVFWGWYRSVQHSPDRAWREMCVVGGFIVAMVTSTVVLTSYLVLGLASTRMLKQGSGVSRLGTLQTPGSRPR